MVLVLFRLRRGTGRAAFHVPFYPVLPLVFLLTYVALFLGAAVQQPGVTAVALSVLALTWVLSLAALRQSKG